jgi:hypothetical protein
MNHILCCTLLFVKGSRSIIYVDWWIAVLSSKDSSVYYLNFKYS